MTDLHAAFEADLHAAWQARDFGAWSWNRSVYADWLEERNHALFPMARTPCRMHPCTVRTNGGPRVWLWRLYFDLAADIVPARRWWQNLRMNRRQTLGFPPGTLRCKGFEEDYGRYLRFTVAFKPHAMQRWVRRNRGVLADDGEMKDVAFDDAVHVAGFAAAFWPPGWFPSGWQQMVPERDKQKTLFE